MLPRLISGFALAGGIIAILLYTPWWAMGIVVLVAMLLATGEFQKMARPDAPRRDLLILQAAALAVIAYPVLQRYWPAYGHGAGLMVGFFILSIGRLAAPLPVDTALRRLSFDAMGFLYVASTFPFIFLLRDRADGGWILVMVMAITFLGDTGAYFAGRFLGKHKLYPAISPKKTIEGAVGGVVTAIGGAFIARAYFPGHDVLTPLDCVLLGGLGASFGVIGDLVESLMKRAFGVKDSGDLIPGHGGVLDRIDGLLFCGPFAWLYLEMFVQW